MNADENSIRNATTPAASVDTAAAPDATIAFSKAASPGMLATLYSHRGKVAAFVTTIVTAAASVVGVGAWNSDTVKLPVDSRTASQAQYGDVTQTRRCEFIEEANRRFGDYLADKSRNYGLKNQDVRITVQDCIGLQNPAAPAPK